MLCHEADISCSTEQGFDVCGTCGRAVAARVQLAVVHSLQRAVNTITCAGFFALLEPPVALVFSLLLNSCHTLPPIFLLSSWFLPDPPDPPTRCSESEDSSDFNSRIYSSNSLCFLNFFLRVSLMSGVLHTVINSVYVQTLPTEQATPALTDFFSHGHDPFTLTPVRPGL